jgi:hypothetical protein
MLVVDATACGADEHRTRLHARERGRIDHASACSRRAGSAATRRRHCDPASRPRVAGSRAPRRISSLLRKGSTASTVHAERVRECGHPPADVADADQTDRLAGHLAAGQVFAREAALGAQAAVALGDAMRDRQDQSERMCSATETALPPD